MAINDCILVRVTNRATGEVLEKYTNRTHMTEVARELIQYFRDLAPSDFNDDEITILFSEGN